MFDIFQKEIKVSDNVKLYLTSGKEIECEVIEIGDNYILIQTPGGTKTRFFETLIGGWDLIASVKNDIVVEEPQYNVTNDEQISETKVGLKIVGKIDLDELENRTGKPFHSKNQPAVTNNMKDIDLSGNFKSFEELKSRLNEIDKEKLVPANGTIIKHRESSGYGFLRTPEGEEIYFKYKDIIDDELKNRIKGERYLQNIQVTFSKFKYVGRHRGIALHLPWKVERCFLTAMNESNQIGLENSIILCEQILTAFPNYQSATDLKKELENIAKAINKKDKSIEPTYWRGKKAKDRKNYTEAIDLLTLAISNNEKLDSAIKDLVSCYQELGEIDKGLSILEKHINKLQINSSTYNFVSNYYSAAKQYEKAIDYLDKLIGLTPNNKQIDVLSRKAFCLIQINEYDKALALIEDIQLLKPSHPSVTWINQIQQAKLSGTYSDLNELVEDISFSTFAGGIPPVLLFSLDRCDYTGLKVQDITKLEFNEDSLKSIRSRIERETAARPREKAKYLLTEAKLIQYIEAHKENLFRSVLSRYCHSLANSMLAENYPIDVIRYFYLLSIELAYDHNILSTLFVRYLMSNNLQGITLLSKNDEPIAKVLIELFDLDKFDIGFLIEPSFYNSTIATTIAKRIFDNGSFKKKTLKYINDIGIPIEHPNPSRDMFNNLWKKAIEKRKSDEVSQLSFIKSLIKENNLAVFYSNFLNINTNLNRNWLTSLDNRRIDDFYKNCSYALSQYLNKNNFDEKERQKGIIIGQITQLMEEIEEHPTRFSFDILLPLIKHIEIILNQSFKKLLESSTPKVTMAILGESRYIDDRNNVSVQLAIRNQSGCSPIHDIKIHLSEDDNYRVLEPILTSSETLKGGGERIINIPLNVSKSIIEQEATTINVSLEYKSRDKEELNILPAQTLALRLYSSVAFDTIHNPYSALADSGPVKDKKMFFGREKDIEDISNLLLSSPSHKFIDIYGQKRSGKSSLLYHLKQKLKESGNFICIDFTLGLTAKYDSASFFWLILDGIERFIDDYEYDEFGKPIFETPKLQELLTNPSIIFYEKIRDFNKEIKKYENWKGKRLLLLIDEFTYLYSATLKKILDPEFMKTWKSMLEKGLFSAIVVGQDIMPKFKAKFPNEFGVFEDKRLTYLKKEDAEKLIEEPLWDKINDKSRFIGQAINRILDYTSLNPYYIQIFCARLVDFMNDHKLINVTEADVITVANSFVEGSHALPLDKFDNLLNAGDADLEAVPQKETLEILRQIANNSRVLGSCPRESISLKSIEYDDYILDDLNKRDVITCPNNGYYRIQVQIFNDWLLKH
jgi:outer membrane protein assembly factor BamD (BamD/ComL family)